MSFFRACLYLVVAALSCKTPNGAGGAPAGNHEGEGAPAEALRITLVGTNDVHGWVAPHVTRLADGGEVTQGGVATFAGYLKILREANPGGVVLLDAGDIFQGTLVSNLTEGEVVVDAFNALGYQAAAIGNHEFDYGPQGPFSVVQPGMDPFGALKARLKQAKFPLLAVNIYDASTGARPAWLLNDGTVMLEVKKVKVGIVGLITPTTPTVTNPVNVSSLRFGSLVPEALAASQRLRAKGAHLVVGLAHAGGKCASTDNPKDLASCDVKSGEIFEALQGLPPKTFDAVIAGHTHSVIGHLVNGTPVVETWGLGRYFSTIDLYLDLKKKVVLEEKTILRAAIPICTMVDTVSGGCEARKLKEQRGVKLLPATFLGKPVVPDSGIAELIRPALNRVEKEQRRALGLTVPATMGRNYEAESALGSFLADSLRAMEKSDVALLNSGGLRADLHAGELTYGAIYEVLPFDNTVANVTLTGEELRRLLHAAYGSRKGVFQVSGLQVSLSRCPGHDRLRAVTLVDGKAIEPQRRYRVTLPDFLARGGDGLGAVLSALPPGRIDLGESRALNFREAMVAHWQKAKKPLVAPKPGRVAFVDDGSSCSTAAKLDGHGGGP